MAEHYCVEHQTVFFKKGSMRNYAHPVKDSTGKTTWCNEPDLEASSEAPQAKPSPAKDESGSKPPVIEHKSSPETGMWWKELGDMLRCGDIDKTTLEGKSLRKAYYAEMFRVLGINIKEVQPAKKLLEEVMKLGKEVKK